MERKVWGFGLCELCQEKVSYREIVQSDKLRVAVFGEAPEHCGRCGLSATLAGTAKNGKSGEGAE